MSDTTNAAEVKSYMLGHMLYQLHFVAAVTEYGGKGVSGIADVFGITQTGLTHEIEVKVDRQDLMGELNAIALLKAESPDDLFKDKKKKVSKSFKHGIYLGRNAGWGGFAHDLKLRPNYFSFVVPYGLMKLASDALKETPYGLWWLDVHENGGHPYGDISCHKRATFLHKDKPDQNIILNIVRKASSEVEILRRRIAEGRRCTKCLKGMPSRCDGCEKQIRESREYRKACDDGFKLGLSGVELNEYINTALKRNG